MVKNNKEAYEEILKGLDPAIGYGGDSVPVATQPFMRFLDAMSQEVKDGAHPANVFLDSMTGMSHSPPIVINPLYSEVHWVEWPSDDRGNPVFGKDPVFQTRSYEEALAHFPKEGGRSTEYFYRKYVVLANVDVNDGSPMLPQRILQFRKSSARAAERMISSSKTIMFPQSDKVAPLFTQWWELGTEDAVSKQTGSSYKRQTLKFKELDTDPASMKSNIEFVTQFSKGGGFILPSSDAPKALSEG